MYRSSKVLGTRADLLLPIIPAFLDVRTPGSEA
jgi:hypothetical protein